MNINEFRITYALPTYLCKVKRRNNIDQSYVYVDNFWEKCRCLILILVKKAEKRKANDEPTDPETPRNKDLKYDREKRTRTFQNSWINKFPWLLGSSLTRMLRKCTASTVENFHTCQIGKMSLLGELKIYALINTRSTCYVSSIGLRNLMIPRQLPVLHRPFTFADTPKGQSLFKLDESQRKRL